MANCPSGLIYRGVNNRKVAGLRDGGMQSEVRTFRVRLNKAGEIMRDKSGVPILGRKVRIVSC